MSELIPFAKTIKSLTTDSEKRQKIHDNFKYHAITKGLIYTNKTTKHYQVDAKEFYDWVKKEFPDLKANIPDEYRLARSIFSLDQTYNLTALPPFTNLEEAAVIIQAQADEIEDLKQQY